GLEQVGLDIGDFHPVPLSLSGEGSAWNQPIYGRTACCQVKRFGALVKREKMLSWQGNSTSSGRMGSRRGARDQQSGPFPVVAL
ncbi:MAG: hypothetical protein ACOCTI_02270, partial [Phycisphaeraceae bacterium]